MAQRCHYSRSSEGYYDLIKRLGLDWNEYKSLLPKTWQIYEITDKGWTLSPGGCLRLLKGAN